MHELDATEDDVGAAWRFEAKHWPDTALDPAMILLDPIVHILAVADLGGDVGEVCL